tara:strand:+ start:1084 stop:1341 length:258 start_codon:yes stop_codon:yes gene_type:complete
MIIYNKNLIIKKKRIYLIQFLNGFIFIKLFALQKKYLSKLNKAIKICHQEKLKLKAKVKVKLEIKEKLKAILEYEVVEVLEVVLK